METLPVSPAFCEENLLVNGGSSQRDQEYGVLMLHLLLAWTRFEQTTESPVIWNIIALMRRHCNEKYTEPIISIPSSMVNNMYSGDPL